MPQTVFVRGPGNPSEMKTAIVKFGIATAPGDVNYLVLWPKENPLHLLSARIHFQKLDTFSAGVDIDLETDDGTTETVVATYDTVGGGSATAVDTFYSMPLESLTVPAGVRLQLRVDDDEDVACAGQVVVEYVEINN